MNKYSEKFERNREIITKYLFDDSTTMQSIGDEYGITRERVRQILERYGVTAKPQSKIAIRKDRLYKFLLEYKAKNDGNTPTLLEMRDRAKLSTSTRVEGCLIHLENDGLIEFYRNPNSKNKNKHQIKIVGAKWIPPK